MSEVTENLGQQPKVVSNEKGSEYVFNGNGSIGIRCAFTYVIFPILAPVLGIASGVGSGIGLVASIIGIAANVFGIGRLHSRVHRRKWRITALNVASDWPLRGTTYP